MRIDDNYLRGNRVDGEVVYSSDFNELETVVKTAINANYEDILKNLENINKHEDDITLVKDQANLADWRVQELQNHLNTFISDTYITDISRIEINFNNLDIKVNSLDTTVNSLVDNYNNLYGTVNGVNDAVNRHENAIRIIDETLSNLQENGTISSVPVYYYNGLHNQENLDMFNEICGLFDNKSPFVLVGRFEVELQTGEDTFEMEEVIAPIQVKNYTDRETGGTVLSFATAPIWLGSQYNIATIGLVGEWGNFTGFRTIGWSALQGPSVNVKTFEGYDETKTQVLKNINGVLTWVEE